MIGYFYRLYSPLKVIIRQWLEKKKTMAVIPYAV